MAALQVLGFSHVSMHESFSSLQDPLKASRKDIQDWAIAKLHPSFNPSLAECGMPFDAQSATLTGFYVPDSQLSPLVFPSSLFTSPPFVSCNESAPLSWLFHCPGLFSFFPILLITKFCTDGSHSRAILLFWHGKLLGLSLVLPWLHALGTAIPVVIRVYDWFC